MSRPKISVITPCYNLGQYLDEAVDSVFAQTYQDFEIVIVNDGSTDDDTNRLLAAYRRPRTRVFTTPNRGVAPSRNFAVAQSEGEYLCALDPDDKLDRTYFEKAVAILDAQPEIAFVSCWLQTFGDENWTWKQERCDLPMLLAECTVATPALVRKAAVLTVGGFDEAITPGFEDWALWLSLVECGFQGTILPEVLFHYRRRPNSLSQNYLQGVPHLNAIRHLLQKHAASYTKHLFEVLLKKDAECCEVLKTNYGFERDLAAWQVPLVQTLEAELHRLRQKLGGEVSSVPAGH
jgi:glycosyltransferase involved in cell wall biosynthesis